MTIGMLLGLSAVQMVCGYYQAVDRPYDLDPCPVRRTVDQHTGKTTSFLFLPHWQQNQAPEPATDTDGEATESLEPELETLTGRAKPWPWVEIPVDADTATVDESRLTEPGRELLLGPRSIIEVPGRDRAGLVQALNAAGRLIGFLHRPFVEPGLQREEATEGLPRHQARLMQAARRAPGLQAQDLALLRQALKAFGEAPHSRPSPHAKTPAS